MNSQAFVGQGRIISNEENEAPLDGLTWLQQQRGQGLDLVFLDPPFDGALFEPALQAAAFDLGAIVALTDVQVAGITSAGHPPATREAILVD